MIGGDHGTEFNVLCPVCGWEYVHPVAVKIEPVNGDTVVYINRDGIRTFVCRAADRLRGIQITTTYLCEESHQWDEVRAFHKGVTYVETHRGPDWTDPELMPTTIGGTDGQGSCRMRARCAGCRRRIPRSEPDLILHRMAPENPAVTALRLLYHERCKDAALERIQGAEPAFWRMTRRYVEAEAN